MGSSKLKQIKIYTGKCFRLFAHEKGWKTFISAAIITLLIASVTSDDTFSLYNDTRNGAFALICACIWIGIFNSIQSICKERDIIKREHRSGLHISSYVCAHMLFELVLCLVEAVIVTTVTCYFNADNLPTDGALLPGAVELFVSFFLIIYSSDLLGLMVSGIVKTPNTAMTVMPFVLIIQLVMSGMIFELEGATEVVSKFTIAKWGLDAICVTADVNAMPVGFQDVGGKDVAVYAEVLDQYEQTLENLLGAWGLLVAFALLYAAICIISLKFIDRDKR